MTIYVFYSPTVHCEYAIQANTQEDAHKRLLKEYHPDIVCNCIAVHEEKNWNNEYLPFEK